MSDTPREACTCGSADPMSARFGHSHLAWCKAPREAAMTLDEQMEKALRGQNPCREFSGDPLHGSCCGESWKTHLMRDALEALKFSEHRLDEQAAELEKMTANRNEAARAYKELRATVQQLEAAIRWALGEAGVFGAEPSPQDGEIRPLYWWRSELRERAGMADQRQQQETGK